MRPILARLLSFSLSSFLVSQHALAQVKPKEHVYVWQFESNLNDNGLTSRLIGWFEEAVQSSGQYVLIDRRQLDKLTEHRKDEVNNLRSLGNDNVQLIKGKGADAVFFGSISRDPNGEVLISVTLESFDTEIELKRSTSVKQPELQNRLAMLQKYREILSGQTPVGPNTPPIRHGGETPISQPPGIDIDNFTYRFLGNSRGASQPMVRVRFDWGVRNLPEGRCTFQIIAGNVVVDQGLQSRPTGRTEVAFHASLKDLSKTLTITCGSKSARLTAVEADGSTSGGSQREPH